MTWKTAALVLAFVLVLAYIVHYRIQKMREAGEADVRRMNDLLLAVERHAGRVPAKKDAGLSADTAAAIEEAKKIVVVCSFKEGRITADEEGGECAVLLYGSADSYHALYTSKRLELAARFARRLGRILSLPIEMI
jgi:hypothetical protein